MIKASQSIKDKLIDYPQAIDFITELEKLDKEYYIYCEPDRWNRSDLEK